MKHAVKALILIAIVLAMVSPSMAQDKVEVTVWFSSGQGPFRDAMTSVIEAFNEQSDTYEMVQIAQPSGNYNDIIASAALADDLPCVLDFDGPHTAQYVHNGWIIPIGDKIDQAVLDDMLPSIIAQGTVDGSLYSLGVFDSGLAIWGNRAMLEEAGVRIPEGVEDVWTLEEFNEALAALSAIVPEDGYAIDLELANTGEWYSYAFGPILRSFGGDTINRDGFDTAEGYLNGDAAYEFASWFVSVVENGYTNTEPVDPTDDFINGRTPLSYVGHWRFPQYSEGLGDNLVLIPMPDFGNGPVTGMGSFAWGMSSNCGSPEAEAGGAAFLNYLLSPENVRIVTQASGGPPASITAAAMDERFQEGGPMYIYAQQLEHGFGIPRAQTPVYPAISSAMEVLMNALKNGEPIQESLDEAVDTIDAAIEALNE